MVAEFNADLQFSQDQATQPWWREVYGQAFPDMTGMHDVRNDCEAQIAGVDRIVVTSAGRIWKIDEKVRRKDYGDILLEYISNDRKRSPGWVVKDLACDYIAYAIVPSRACYLLPVPALQRAWLKHGNEWLRKYGSKISANDFYNTLNCPVPVPVLMHKIAQAMFFRWSDFNEAHLD